VCIIIVPELLCSHSLFFLSFLFFVFSLAYWKNYFIYLLSCASSFFLLSNFYFLFQAWLCTSSSHTISYSLRLYLYVLKRDDVSFKVWNNLIFFILLFHFHHDSKTSKAKRSMCLCVCVCVCVFSFLVFKFQSRFFFS